MGKYATADLFQYLLRFFIVPRVFLEFVNNPERKCGLFLTSCFLHVQTKRFKRGLNSSSYFTKTKHLVFGRCV